MAHDSSQTGNVPCLLLLLWDFCPCVQVFTPGTFLHMAVHCSTHTHTHSYSSDNCHSSPALRSWTGLTTSVCINTWLLPLGCLLFIAVMFTRTQRQEKKSHTCIFFLKALCSCEQHVTRRLYMYSRTRERSFHAIYSHIVKVKLDLGVYQWSTVGTQLCASINTADKISLLLSMTDFEFMTPLIKWFNMWPLQQPSQVNVVHHRCLLWAR